MFRKLMFFIFTVFSAVFSVTPALAQSAPAPNPLMGTVVPVIFMLGVMYLLMIRPQIKKQKEHQTFLSALERGSEVVTSSGILGRIEGLTETHATLEIAPGVRIKILRSAIAGSSKPAATASAEVKA